MFEGLLALVLSGLWFLVVGVRFVVVVCLWVVLNLSVIHMALYSCIRKKQVNQNPLIY